MRDFTSGGIAKQLLWFSLPMLIGSLFQQAYSMADAVVAGRLIGGNTLAAVGVAMTALNFLLAILMGLTTGASVVISQFYGAKRYDKLNATVSTSVVFLAMLSAAITLFGVMLSPRLLRLLNSPPEIFDEASAYLRILLGATIFPTFYNMYTAYLRALGDSRNPLFILIFTTTLNVALDVSFVIFFKMGVEGLALATILSQALSALLCYLYTRRFVPLLNVAKLSFDPDVFRSILKFGVPAAAQLSLVSLASLTITRLINSFGASAMAGITVSSRIDNIAIMPVSVLSMALSTFVAQNMGAGYEERAKKGFHTSLLIMVGLAVCTTGFLVVFGPRLILLFLDSREAGTAGILRVGSGYLSIMSMFYFLFAFMFAFNGFFRGAGDAVIAMVFPVVSLTLRAVTAHLLVGLAGMGPEALAWSIPVGWGVTSLASFAYYKKRLWAGKAITAVGADTGS